MFLIDDLVLRMFGLSIKPFDMIWYLELIKDYALKEKYNIPKINNKIKENILLLEIGQITQKEYNQKHEELLNELDKAKKVMENLSKDVKIREGM